MSRPLGSSSVPLECTAGRKVPNEGTDQKLKHGKVFGGRIDYRPRKASLLHPVCRLTNLRLDCPTTSDALGSGSLLPRSDPFRSRTALHRSWERPRGCKEEGKPRMAVLRPWCAGGCLLWPSPQRLPSFLELSGLKRTPATARRMEATSPSRSPHAKWPTYGQFQSTSNLRI